MSASLKFDATNYTDEPSLTTATNSTLIPANVSTFQRSISADEIEQIKKIELLEKQIDALYVVSKRLDTKEKKGTELLGLLKEKLFTLSDKQDLESEAFAEQFNHLQQNLKELAKLFKNNLATYKKKHEEDHARIAEHIDQQVKMSNQKNESKIKKVEEKNELFDVYLKTLDNSQQDLLETQEKQGEQLTDLQGITDKLTNISGQLTTKVNQHDQQIEQLETVSTEQQGSINELFDQTHDLHEQDAKLLKQYTDLQEELTTLEQQHNNLLSSTKAIEKQQLLQVQTVNKKFKWTHALTSISLAIIVGASTAYYVSNNKNVDSLQHQSAYQLASITQLDTLTKNTAIEQAALSQQMSALELELSTLKQDYRNNRIDMTTFEQRQDVIGVQLNQIASQISHNQKVLSEELKNQSDNEAFYKRIQFARPNGKAVYDQSWVDMQSNKKFTIQLMSSPVKQDVLNFVKVHDLEGEIAFRETYSNGKKWYSIVKGSYASKTEARKDISLLPVAVLPNKPLVRSFKLFK